MRPRSRTTALTVAVCSALVVLAACTSETPEQSSREVAPKLDRFYAQTLAWGPCGPFATPNLEPGAFDDPTFDCARLEVPLDYRSPDGRTAQIGVLRQKATGEKIGSLLVNPDGPGASGMSFVASLSGRLERSPLRQRFDLIGFDPRGVGASTPTIDCLDDAEWEVERADLDVDPSPAGVEQTEAENREFVERCVERSGGADVLATVGTRDAAQDVDVLRAALGDEKLTYLGYSYGTRLGSAYAEAFPQNVRALVLDGALDPTQTTVDRIVAQNAGFQEAFGFYVADCARRRGCPLGADPRQATAMFQAVTRALIDAPAPAGDGRTLSYPDAIIGTMQGLYRSSLWPLLSEGITALTRGDGSGLLRLADIYYDRGGSGVYGNAREAFIAISCVDEERITDRGAAADLTWRLQETAPIRDAGRGVVAALGPCAFWPVPPTSEPHVPTVVGLPRTLVISVTGDPATPYLAGVGLAKALDGSLLSVQGVQHTAVLQGNACVDGIVSAYLIDLTLADESFCAL